MHRLWQDESGQTLPLTVLFLLVLLGVIALVLDGGNAYAQKRRMQNAADAAALSSVMILVRGESRDAVVRQTATDYARANGADTVVLTYLDAGGNVLPNPTNGVVPANAGSIRVTARRAFAPYVARLFGFATMTASATARATALPGAMPNQFPGLSPLSVPLNFYEACSVSGSRCDLWDSSYASAWGVPASQFKSLIDLSNGTAGNLPQMVSTWTQYGYPGAIAVGTTLPAISGNYGNNVADALRQRILANPSGIDPDGVIWGSIDMAIWDSWVPANKDLGTPMQVHIAKFGRFKIRLTDISGSHAYGSFMNFVVPGHERSNDPVHAGPKIIVFGE